MFQDHYISIICFLIAIYAATFIGCSLHRYDTSVCRHNAAYTAILHKAEHPEDEVKICLGWCERCKLWHAQTKYRVAGQDKWTFIIQPLAVINMPGSQDDFEIRQEYSIKEWLKNYLKVIE